MIDLDAGDSLDSLPEWMKQRGPVSSNGPLLPAGQGAQLLADAVERYELANGELQWPKLAGPNLKEFRAPQLVASAPGGKVN